MEVLYGIIVFFISFFASLLTFISGFGLGTILLPVFMVFLPTPLAISATAIVHLINNTTKLGLLYKSANVNILIRFGLPALIGAGIGAWLLNVLQFLSPFYHYSAFGAKIEVLPIHFFVGIVILLFAFIDDLKLTVTGTSNKFITFGGFLSGFFGGLSGHQGALRSLVLSKMEMSKEQFLATGVVIACVIDIIRLIIYGSSGSFTVLTTVWISIVISVIGAVIGALLGSRIMKKITNEQFHRIVKYMLAVFGLLLCSGILNK